MAPGKGLTGMAAHPADAAKTAPSRVLVMLPSYNDHDGLPALCADIARHLPDARILVIDDGSRAPVERDRLPADVLIARLPDNYGLGVGMHIAFDHMLAQGYDGLVRLDSDGQHPAAEAPALLALLAGGETDLAVGVRTNAGNGPGLRARLTRWVHAYYRRISRLVAPAHPPDDPASGFMAFNRCAAERLNREHYDRYPEPDIRLFAASAGLRVRTHEIEQRARSQGRSTISFERALLLLYRFNVLALTLLTRGGRRA